MVYLLASLAAMGDIIGGLLPFLPKTQNINMRFILSFAAGTVLAAAFFELLPEAKVGDNYLFLGLGFVLFYLVESGLELHTGGDKEYHERHLGWVTVVGMASDNIIDGIGIGVSFLVSPLVGVIIALAVIVHEVPQGMTTTHIMRSAGYKTSRLVLIILFAAAAYPLGVAVSGYIPEAFFTRAIAFVAGVFIYVGATLLAEVHREFNYRIVATLVLGMAVVLGLNFLE
ncbi:MAG: ZIP family metal transporter [Chloroflexi bacterium]|nr:ZIP family metal transporter [Chloroflexota bacterium]